MVEVLSEAFGKCNHFLVTFGLRTQVRFVWSFQIPVERTPLPVMECSVMRAILIHEGGLHKPYAAVEDKKFALQRRASIGIEQHSFDHEAPRHWYISWFVHCGSVASAKPILKLGDRRIRINVLSLTHY